VAGLKDYGVSTGFLETPNGLRIALIAAAMMR
jgi:hypothetical protein